MEFLRDPNINFMKYRRAWIVASIVLNLVAAVALGMGRLNMGIDFAGGTQLTLRFRERPPIDELRAAVAAAGVGDALIQPFGGDDSDEVMIRTPLAPEVAEGSQERIVAALERHFGADPAAFDLNRTGSEALAERLFAADPDQLSAQDEATARAHYETVAAAIVSERRDLGLFASWDEFGRVPGVSGAVRAELERGATLGAFTVLGAENVGPQIGAELRKKGILAVAFSLLGMLLYIWYRFELRFGVGALIASGHDVLVVLGLFAVAGFEFNLTTIAAFLTLVGYSVNDTVVIFDRVRENMRRNPREPIVETMNRSLNQTLSRTILTGGCTLLATGALLAVGGEVLRGFAFIIFMGVLVGTYSSIYIASPFAILWERLFGEGKRRKGKGSSSAPGRARAASR